jgi:hypothetical protein
MSKENEDIDIEEDDMSMASMFGQPEPAQPEGGAASEDPGQSSGGGGEGGEGGGQAPGSGDDDEARFSAWYAKFHPEAPEGISKLDNWKQVRQSKEAVTKSLWKAEQALQDREKSITSLKAELDDLRGKGGALPESEAVARLQAELAAERQAKAQELSEWQAHKAKQELEGNHAFLAEFDGKRARIEDEVREVVKEAGLGDDVAAAVLAAGSRYKLTQALADLDDPAAVKVLTDLGLEFTRLSNDREAAVKAPADHLKKWRDYEQAMMGGMVQETRKKAVDTWNGALPKARELLVDDPLFQTEAGRSMLADLERNIGQGLLPTVEQSIASLAKAAASDFYREAWMESRAKAEELQAKLARYAAADTGASVAGPATKTAGSGIGDHWFDD